MASGASTSSRFLVKAGRRSRGRNSVIVATDLMVEHPIMYRRLEEQDSPIGPVGRLESTGKRDPKRFHFVVRQGTYGTGSETSRSRCQTESPTTAAGTKKVIRTLRPQEAEKLDALDQQRRELLNQLDALEANRDELVREVFSKGHAVRVSDLKDMAAMTERRFQKRKMLLNSLSDRSVDQLHELLETDFVKEEQYLIDRIREELGNRSY